VGAGGGAGAVIFYPGYVISAGSYDVTGPWRHSPIC
jgi:hypothetical protein